MAATSALAENHFISRRRLPGNDFRPEGARAQVSGSAESAGFAQVVGACEQFCSRLQSGRGSIGKEIDDGEATLAIDREHAADETMGTGAEGVRGKGRRGWRRITATDDG